VAAPTAGLHFTRRSWTRFRLEASNGWDHAARRLRHVQARSRRARRGSHGRSRNVYDRRGRRAAISGAVAEGRRVVAVERRQPRARERGATGRETRGADIGSDRSVHPPGFEFRVVGALLTNFHLPRSSLLMMVCASPAGRRSRSLQGSVERVTVLQLRRRHADPLTAAELKFGRPTSESARAPRNPWRAVRCRLTRARIICYAV